MGDYLTIDDVAESPDEPPADIPTMDSRVLLTLAATLDAMRSQIDAALIVIDGLLDPGDGRPVMLASSDVTGAEEVDCRHPVERRQKLNLIGSGDDRPRWRCRDCGHEHNPEEG